MLQLAKFSLALLQQPRGDVGFAIEGVGRAAVSVTQAFLTVRDSNPMSNVHSSYMAPYYSAVSEQSFPAQFARLCEALAQSEAGHAPAGNILRNMESWSNKLYRSQREMLQAVVTARSPLSFDIIKWIETVATGLVHAAASQACPPHTRSELIKNAAWLSGSLTWVPNDAEAVRFAENYGVTEALSRFAFDIGGAAHARHELGSAVESLTNWGLKASQHPTGRETLPACLAGSALAITNAGAGVLAQDICQAVARRVNEHLRKHNLDVAAVVESTRRRFVEEGPEEFSTDFVDIARKRVNDAAFREIMGELLEALPRSVLRLPG
jgi:hypothetical protein